MRERSRGAAPRLDPRGDRTDFSSVRLSTRRLELRALRPGDEAPLFRIYSNPAFMRYWSSPPWTSLDQAARLVADDQRDLKAGVHLRLGIVRRSDGQLIGTSSLFNLDASNGRAEIGFGIAPDCWRNGYMTEAVSALVEYAFSGLALRRLEADLDPRNTASAKAVEKLGFIHEGQLRERWLVAGEVSDSAIYGLLATDPRSGGGAGPELAA